MKYPVLLLFFLFCCRWGVAQYSFSSLDKVLEAQQKKVGGQLCMLIYKDGKTVYERGLGGYTPGTVEPVASCSKWLTAALVMTFVEEGKLSLEDTIGKFLPLFTKYKKGKIKIWHCLSHTTGIQEEQITMATVLNRSKYKSLEEEVNDIAQKAVTAPPGEQFFYGGSGLNIAGRILEIIGKKDFEMLFQERIAGPLGMKSTSFASRHAVNPSGGLASSPSDYMNFLIMLLQKGSFKGKRILKEESVEKMEQEWTADVKVAVAPEQAIGLEYALGAWILEKDEDDVPLVLSSPGLFGTFPYVDLGREYAAILFVKSLTFKNRKETYAAVKAAADKVFVLK